MKIKKKAKLIIMGLGMSACFIVMAFAITDPVTYFNISSEDENVPSVADSPSWNEAYFYDEHILPENSVGCGDFTIQRHNWSYFWQKFMNHASWQLEAWHPVQEIWVSEWQGTNLNDWLTISKIRSADNSSEKVTLNVTNNHPTQDLYFRFTFGIDARVKQYVNRSSWYEYELTYQANESEDVEYKVIFNFSDVKTLVQNGVIHQKHGIKNIDGVDYFYFRLTQNMSRNPLQSGNSFEIDPQIGTTSYSGMGHTWTSTDYRAQRIYPKENMILHHVFAYVGYGNIGTMMQCGVYEEMNSSYDYSTPLVHITVTNTRDDVDGYWARFNFTDAPTLYENHSYYLTFYAAYCKIWTATSGGNGSRYDSNPQVPSGIWNNLNDWSSAPDEDGKVAVYAVYTHKGYKPAITDESPVAGALNQSATEVTISARITSRDGNSSNCNFFTSTDNVTWTNAQYNSSVPDGDTIRYTYPTGATGTDYYWWITANNSDGDWGGNRSLYGNFKTTIYGDTYYNDTFLTEDFIHTKHNLTHSDGTESFSNDWTIASTVSSEIDESAYIINSDMYDGTFDYGPTPRVVFIDNDTGYAVGMDTSGSDEPHLYKTTDAGDSWTDMGTIDSATDPTDGWAGAMWYDRWTIGDDSGDKIYLAYIGDDVDDLEFNYIDTTDDSYRGSWNAVHSWGSADGGDGSPAMCKTTDDILWIGGFGATTGEIYNSSDGGASWTSSKPASLFDDDDDNMQMFPMPDGDIMCVYWDLSAQQVGYFTYSKTSPEGWGGFNLITNVGSGAISDWVGSGTYDRDTGDIWLPITMVNYGIANQYNAIWTYTADNSTWWELINFSNRDFGYSQALGFHEPTDTLYYGFSNSTTQAVMDVFYCKSTDRGLTWSEPIDIITVRDDYRVNFFNFINDYIILLSWSDEDNNRWHGVPVETWSNPKDDGYLLSDIIWKTDGATWDELYAGVNNSVNCDFALVDPYNSTYNITSGLNGDGDDISAVTNSSVRIYANFSNIGVELYYWNITWTTGEEPPEEPTNTIPTVSGEAPVNGSTDVVNGCVDVYAIVSDADGNLINASWTSNSSGSWLEFGNNHSVSSGTNITQQNCNFSDCGTTYWLNITVDDGNGSSASYWFSFTTEACYDDNVPVLGNETPSNGSSNIAVTTNQLSVDIYDDNASFDWTIQVSDGATTSGSNGNGQKTLTFGSNLNWSTTYKWWVNVTDSNSTVYSWWYQFTTEDYDDNVPVISEVNPANGSTNVYVNRSTVSVNIVDDNGTFDWTIQVSDGATTSGSNTNGTKTLTFGSNLNWSTTYKWWVNVTDSNSTVYSWWYQFTTESYGDVHPTVQYPNPGNSSTSVYVNRSSLSIYISDDNQTFDYTIEVNDGGSSIGSDTNGTKTHNFDAALNYSTSYKWWVNVTDGSNTFIYFYIFTTESYDDNVPVVGNATPANGTTNVAVSTSQLTVDIYDDNASFSWKIEVNDGGSSVGSDTNGQKSHSFDAALNYSMVYTWYLNITDSNGTVYAYWYQFTTIAFGDTAPIVSDENPNNNSIDVPVTNNSVSVSIVDDNGSFDWTIQVSDGATEKGSDTNGTKTLTFDNNLNYSHVYTWYLNITDSNGTIYNYVYSFTTASYDDNVPVLGNATPSNSSTGVVITTSQLTVDIYDDNASFSWKIEVNDGGSSVGSDTNGQKSHSFDNDLNYSTTYKWWVNVTDSNSTVYSWWYQFTTQSVPGAITVTSVYPGNSSTDIPLQPIMYATINSSTGRTMNVTWYWGTSAGNETTLIETDSSFTNGTQTALNYNASSRSTDYYWKMHVHDGTSHFNFTYAFTTEGLGGGFMPTYTGLIAAAFLFSCMSVVILFMKKREKNKGGY